MKNNSGIYTDSVLETAHEYIEKYSASSNAFRVNQEFHNLQVCDCIYMDSDGLYKKATLETNFDVIGIVSSVSNENVFEYKIYGKIITDRYAFNNGEILFLTNNGELSNIPESIIKPVCIQTSNGLIVNIQQAINY